jgi:hypothetical protein
MTDDKQPLDSKTALTYFMQHDLGTFMTAELRLLSGKSQYSFVVYRDLKKIWEGNLQQLTEMVLLGAVYKARLEHETKESASCKTPTLSSTSQPSLPTPETPW